MPIALRQDYDATTTRAAAKLSKDSGQTRRLLYQPPEDLTRGGDSQGARNVSR